MSIIFNKNRKYQDGETPNYPLFLGETMSLHDMVDTTYPEVEELALLQRSQMWLETEIDLNGDRMQWYMLPPEIQDISILNLAWQSHGDSIAGRAPIMAIMPFVSNPELEELINNWQFFEQIHSRSYQHIIRTVFPNPEEVRNRVANLEEAMERLTVVEREFGHLQDLAAMYTLVQNGCNSWADFDNNLTDEQAIYECKKQLVKAFGALYALESIQFFASFACTFKLADAGYMAGIADILKLIAKDEALHTRFTKAILDILIKDPEWSPIFDELVPFFEEVMYEVVEAEKKWAKFLFSEDRKLVGLNEVLMCEYVDFLATGAFRAVGLTYNSPVDTHPIPWVETYLNPEKVQVAPQERNITNYRVGQVENDASDADFGDMDFGF